MADGFEVGYSEVVKTTDDAVLVNADDLGEEVWVPKSVLHVDSDIDGDSEKGDAGELVVKASFAEKEGW